MLLNKEYCHTVHCDNQFRHSAIHTDSMCIIEYIVIIPYSVLGLLPSAPRPFIYLSTSLSQAYTTFPGVHFVPGHTLPSQAHISFSGVHFSSLYLLPRHTPGRTCLPRYTLRSGQVVRQWHSLPPSKPYVKMALVAGGITRH